MLNKINSPKLNKSEEINKKLLKVGEMTPSTLKELKEEFEKEMDDCYGCNERYTRKALWSFILKAYKAGKKEGFKEGLLEFSKRAEKNFGWKPK